jgi:Skp family chaperone for outer membrane proteins
VDARRVREVMKKAILTLVVLSMAGLVGCAQDNPNVPDVSQDQVEAAEQERIDAQQELEAVEQELEAAEAEIVQMRSDLQEAAELLRDSVGELRSQSRTIRLHRACMQDIIDETNRVYNLFQWAPALRTAFNGANCSALGYYWS